MSTKEAGYRRDNGRRLERHALAARVASELNGMMLAQAFVVSRSAGFRLQVNKSDGVPRSGFAPDDGQRVMVDVVGGFVRKSWATA